MSEYKPITGELRNSMTYKITTAPNGVSTASLDTSVFCALCDAIDSIHANLERENESLKAELDRAHGEWDFWESTHIELPKDADGEYIHVGDVMDSKVDYLFDGKPFTVRALVLCEDGWEVADGRFGNRYEPNSLRHHHAPTVEDVLREFAYGLGVPVADSYIAASAAKLRLAEEEDA